MTIMRVVQAAVYVIGAWIALSVLMIQAPWAPEQALTQAARLVVMGVAVVALWICAVAGGTALLGLAGMTPKPEAAPRPYTPSL